MTSDVGPKISHFDSSSRFVKDMATLYEVDIFKGIEPAELSLIFAHMELRQYPAETILFAPADNTERLFILRKGQVTQYLLTSSGKRLVTRRIKPGSVFGIMGLLGQTMQGNFAETTEDSTVYIVTRDDFLMLLEHQPGITLNILEVVGNRLRILEELLVKAVYSPVSVRLADFLLNSADPASNILSNMTHEEIGDIIGAVRQTVTETLSRMRKRGIILTRPKRIQIIDRYRLQEVSQGSEI